MQVVSRISLRLLLPVVLLVVTTVLPQTALAQRVEIHPYIGGFNAFEWADTATLQREGIYGIRGGVYTTENIELDANFGYINHFRFEDSAASSRAYMWDLNASWNFDIESSPRFEPFFTAGLGGLTASPRDVNIFGVTADSNTYLTLNYGGGVKGVELWGPLGLRADARLRTMPNFHGRVNNWVEVTTGIIFTWGDKWGRN